MRRLISKRTFESHPSAPFVELQSPIPVAEMRSAFRPRAQRYVFPVLAALAKRFADLGLQKNGPIQKVFLLWGLIQV